MTRPPFPSSRRAAIALCAAVTLSLSGLIVLPAASALEAPPPPAPTQRAEEPPAELTEALARDLGVTPAEFAESADLAARLAAAEPRLAELPEYRSVALVSGAAVVYAGAASPELTALAATIPATISVVETGLDAETDPVAPAAADPAAPPLSGEYLELVARLFAVPGVTGVAQGEAGSVVVRTTAREPQRARAGDDQAQLLRLAEEVPGLEIRWGAAPLDPLAETELVGGAGYLASASPDHSGRVAYCSVGFSAWSPAGQPALITAGHCSGDGARPHTATTVPRSEPAYTGRRAPDTTQAPLGVFAFSQYGGPGNAPPGAAPGRDDTDIGVIDVRNPELRTRPGVTRWPLPPTNDLASDTLAVTSLGTAVVGAPVCRSGRTTGFRCATVTEANGWQLVSDRSVFGFAAELAARPGDSGGGVLSNGAALGVTSGYAEGTSYTWVADLSTGLRLTGGYTLSTHVAAPRLGDPADGGTVPRGGPITGTAPVGSSVRIDPAGGEAFDAAVTADGSWSFAAPSAVGDFRFTITAVSGFDRSEAVPVRLTVTAAPPAAPTFTAPQPGARLTEPLAEVSGTGAPGASVAVSGAVSGSAIVSASGRWSLPVSPALGVGAHRLLAEQELAGERSPRAAVEFTIAPPAPSITSPRDGDAFAADSAPETASGTGLDGASVRLTLNGSPLPAAEVRAGAWSAPLGAPLPSGEHVLAATQASNGVESAPTRVRFTVAAERSPGPGAPPGAPGTGPGGRADAPETGGIAATGAELAPAALAAAALLATGAIVALRRRALRARASE